MTSLTQDHVKSLLANCVDEFSGTDIVSLGWLRGIGIDGSKAAVDLRAGYPIEGIRDALLERVRACLEADPQIERATVTLEMKQEYEAMSGRLKQQASAIQPLGFVSPGMLRSHGPKAED